MVLYRIMQLVVRGNLCVPVSSGKETPVTKETLEKACTEALRDNSSFAVCVDQMLQQPVRTIIKEARMAGILSESGNWLSETHKVAFVFAFPCSLLLPQWRISLSEPPARAASRTGSCASAKGGRVPAGPYRNRDVRCVAGQDHEERRVLPPEGDLGRVPA